MEIPKKPAKPETAFKKFREIHFQQIKDENPGKDAVFLTKKTIEAFKNLTEQQQQNYEPTFEQLRIWERDLQEWNSQYSKPYNEKYFAWRIPVYKSYVKNSKGPSNITKPKKNS